MKDKSKISNLLSNIPLLFEKNIGQQDNEVKYILKQNGCTIFFTQGEVVLVSSKKIDENNEERENEKDIDDIRLLKSNIDKSEEKGEYEINLIRMKLENSNKNAEILGEDELNCKLNYFKGSKEDWITDVDMYEKIIYKDVYENIDLVYYSNEGNLEYDFILKPEANVGDIKIIFEGIDNIDIDKDENLKLDIKDSSVYLLKPKTYQVIEDKNVEVKSEFIINENKASFKVDKYDKSKALVIDPILLYSTYIGGSGDDYGEAIAVDSNEIAYITGYTYSTNFPTTPNAYQGMKKGAPDVFLLKIDANLSGSSSLIYSSYIGGSSNSNYGEGIAVDKNEIAYITGYTAANNYPTTPNAYQTVFKGGSDAFLTKIDTKLSGSSGLIYSTYLGGSSNDWGKGVAIDEDENAYITGYTYSIDFPTTPNAYQSMKKGGDDVFLSRIDTKLSGSSGLIYSTYLGGSNDERGTVVAVDKNKNAYITGYTWSTDFPTTPNAYQGMNKGGYDAFLVKINTNLNGSNGLIYSTYIGGSSTDGAFSIDIDCYENAYIIGLTDSNDFPTTPNAYQAMDKGGVDVFLTRIDTKLSGNSSLIYSTYIGGSSYDEGRGIAVDKNKNAYITGYTSSSNFPTTPNAYQTTMKGSNDAFLVKMLTQDPFIDLQMNKVTNLQFADLGTTITYTITLNNSGNVSANNITFIDTIPNGTTFVPNSLNINGTTVPQSPSNVNIGSINAGYTSTVTFKVKVDTIPTLSPIQNSATTTYNYTLLTTMPNGKSGSNNSNIVTTKVNHVDILVNKTTTPVYISCDGTITYTVTLQNIGSTTANNVILRDTIPNQTRFISNSLKVNGTTIPGQNPAVGVNIGSIGPNSIKTVNFEVIAIC